MNSEEHRGRVLPVHLVKRIFRLRREGLGISEIARATGVHRETVYKYAGMSPQEQAELIAAATPRPIA
jgi:hypothetical protein